MSSFPWFFDLSAVKEIQSKDSYYWVELFYDNTWHKLFYTGWNGNGLWFMTDADDDSTEFFMDEVFFRKHKDELAVKVPDIPDKVYERWE